MIGATETVTKQLAVAPRGYHAVSLDCNYMPGFDYAHKMIIIFIIGDYTYVVLNCHTFVVCMYLKSLELRTLSVTVCVFISYTYVCTGPVKFTLCLYFSIESAKDETPTRQQEDETTTKRIAKNSILSNSV